MASATNCTSGNQTNTWISPDEPQASEQTTGGAYQEENVSTGEYTEQPGRIRCPAYISQPYMVIHQITDLQDNENFKALLGTIKTKLHNLKGVEITYIVKYGGTTAYAQGMAEFHTKEYCIKGLSLQQQKVQLNKTLSLAPNLNPPVHPRIQIQSQTAPNNASNVQASISNYKLAPTSEIFYYLSEDMPKTLTNDKQLVVDILHNKRCDAVVYIKDSKDDIGRAEKLLAQEANEDFKVEFNFLANGLRELQIIEFFAKNMDLELKRLSLQGRQSRWQCLIV